jgi:hypothetical protein
MLIDSGNKCQELAEVISVQPKRIRSWMIKIRGDGVNDKYGEVLTVMAWASLS